MNIDLIEIKMTVKSTRSTCLCTCVQNIHHMLLNVYTQKYFSSDMQKNLSYMYTAV